MMTAAGLCAKSRGACGVAPQWGDLGIVDAAIIVPGSRGQSVLLEIECNTMN
jgi:hypothetical protein